MSKMGSHDPFGHFKHKLWLKEGPRVKLPIGFPTTNSGNRPNFLACRWHKTYCWKALDKGYNFALDHISIEGLHTKLWAPKVTGVLVLGILGLPLGSLGTKCHLGASPVARHRVNPLRGGRQHPLQSLEKLRKYKGGSKRHEMAVSPSPKIWP
jgi:hypothetical protein